MLMTSTSTSKKRKRAETSEAHFEVSDVPVGKINPVLVTYPTVEAPPQTAFRCYALKKQKTQTQDVSQDSRILLAGESETVEFVTNTEETQRISQAGCRYMIAVRNKRTNTISLHPLQQTPHLLTRTVKALKSLPSLSAPSKTQFMEAKNTLGETFGTKKQKANIRAQERNKVDISAMEGVIGHVMESIKQGASGLLTNEELQETADDNRLVPEFDASATDPGDIYPLHNIIPEAEWKALSTSAFEDASSEKDKIALLAYRRSDWIFQHVKNLPSLPVNTRRRHIKILIYISAMFAFKQTTSKTIEREKMYERLNTVPAIVVDGLLSRFTETARGSSTHQATSSSKTKLLAHMFALCLKVDKYASNTKILAHDLSLPVPEVNQLFKSLGCKINKLSDQERRKLGIGNVSAEDRHAVLTGPVEFPKPRRKRK